MRSFSALRMTSDGRGEAFLLDRALALDPGLARAWLARGNLQRKLARFDDAFAAYDRAVTMSFRTVNGTAKTGDGDYIARNGTLTFNPGETTKTITIEVKGDSMKEANETFYLDLFGNSGNSLFTKNRGTGTILNDD